MTLHPHAVPACLVTVVLCSFTVVAVGLSGCERDEKKKQVLEDVRREQVRNSLMTLVLRIRTRSYKTDEQLPMDMESLVSFLDPHMDDIEQTTVLELRDGALRDPWGEDIWLITDGDRLLGFGSSGPNRVWEQGQADDIVQELDYP